MTYPGSEAESTTKASVHTLLGKRDSDSPRTTAYKRARRVATVALGFAIGGTIGGVVTACADNITPKADAAVPPTATTGPTEKPGTTVTPSGEVQTPEQQFQSVISQIDAIENGSAAKDPHWQALLTSKVKNRTADAAYLWPYQMPGEPVNDGAYIIPGGIVGAVDINGSVYIIEQVQPKSVRDANNPKNPNPKDFLEGSDFILLKWLPAQKAAIFDEKGLEIKSNQYVLGQRDGNDVKGEIKVKTIETAANVLDPTTFVDSQDPKVAASLLNSKGFVGGWGGFVCINGQYDAKALAFLHYGGEQPSTVLTATQAKQVLSDLMSGKLSSSNAPIAGTIGGEKNVTFTYYSIAH